VQALEYANTDAARLLLKELARGADGEALSIESTRALERIRRGR
jgi:hypothetical protein